ncbi:hypothetical protein K470DRAFT_199820, partial [Piedraia hortae CBS 480.64]
KSYGLQWVENLFELRPRWTVNLDIVAIKSEAKKALYSECSQVSSYAQGSFHRHFENFSGNKTYLMRVSLPVDPYWKRGSEVATLTWVEKNTTMPAPHVVAYSSDRKNAVWFEWMLMTQLPGVNQSKKWRNISFELRYCITELVVKH